MQKWMISLKSSWKIMKFDMQEEKIWLKGSWVIKDLIYLEHTFWSLSVLKDLPLVSLTSMFLTLIYLVIANGKLPYDFSRLFRLFELIFTNFCNFFWKKSFCLLSSLSRHWRGRELLSAVFWKETNFQMPCSFLR